MSSELDSTSLRVLAQPAFNIAGVSVGWAHGPTSEICTRLNVGPWAQPTSAEKHFHPIRVCTEMAAAATVAAWIT